MDYRFVRNGSVDPQGGGLRPCDGHGSELFFDGLMGMRERVHPVNRGTWTLREIWSMPCIVDSTQQRAR